MLEQIFTIIAPVVICVCLGMAWTRSGAAFDSAFVSRIVFYIGVPALLVSRVNELDINAQVLGTTTLIAIGLALTMGLIGILAVKLSGKDASVYLPPLIFGNNGNMGLPLCFLAFGDEGMALALCFFVVLLVGQASIGIALVNVHAGGWKQRLGNLLKQPVIYATFISILLLVTGYKLPRWLGETLYLLSGFSIPLMLIALGTSLISIKISNMRDSLVFALLRVGSGFLLGWITVELLDLEGVQRGVVLIQAAMPAAIFNYLMALRYERDPAMVASLVVTSTLISFLTLPLLLSLALAG